MSERPSERSAVLIRTSLPGGLERLRRACIADATDGVPAHLTLLYPFVAPERRDPRVRAALAEVARDHPAFDYVLAGGARWPDTVYVRVEPIQPFVELQRALQAAFPGYPIYGGGTGFDYVPHVSIAEGPCLDDPAVGADPGWSALPVVRRAASIELLARPPSGSWRTVWRVPLGRPVAVGRMRR